MENKTIIFDFDSTFIQDESLDTLAQVALANHPKRADLLKSIHELTELAMIGRYSVAESLKERIKMLTLHKTHLEQAVERLKKRITPSFIRNKAFFQEHAEQLYIMSGGFIEIIWPIVREFGIKREQVFCNKFIFDFEGNVLGFDEEYVLAQDQGKVKLCQMMNFKNELIIVGDGYNDYEVYESGLATHFFAFTENVKREEVIQSASGEITELEGLFLSLNIPNPKTAIGKKVLLLEGVHPTVPKYFSDNQYEVIYEKKSLGEDELIHALKGVSAIGIRSKTQLNDNVIRNSPQLETIGAFCIGTNQINIDAASKLGISVFNAPFSNTRSVVELAIGNMIMLIRRAAALSYQLHRGKWNKTSNGAFEIRGKTLGIIGYGNIGAQLSVLAENLGMQVVFYDIEEKLPMGNAKHCISQDDVLIQSDVVTIHVDGRPENTNLINADAFNVMKDGVTFLNLSRGSVVEMDALYQALESGKVSGAAIDVFPQEPSMKMADFEHPLQKFDNVILTPHIGGSTEEAQENIGEFVSKNMHAYCEHGTTTGSVNLPSIHLPSLIHQQRIIHMHENIPGILAKINAIFANSDSNIEGQYLKTNNQIGYVITDIDKEISDEDFNALMAIPNTIKVRKLIS